MAEKIKITASEVLKLMKGDPLATPPVEGLDRKQLKAKLGLSHSDMQKLFKHPVLKNKKVAKEAGFEFEDDITGTDEAVALKGEPEVTVTNIPAPAAAEAEAEIELASGTPDKW